MKFQKSNRSDHSLMFVIWLTVLILLMYPACAWMVSNLSAVAVKAVFGTVCALLLLTGALLVSGDRR